MAPGLDRPLLAIPVLGNQVDAAVRPPPSWPVVPQPHVDQPVRLAGVGFSEVRSAVVGQRCRHADHNVVSTLLPEARRVIDTDRVMDRKLALGVAPGGFLRRIR